MEKRRKERGVPRCFVRLGTGKASQEERVSNRLTVTIFFIFWTWTRPGRCTRTSDSISVQTSRLFMLIENVNLEQFNIFYCISSLLRQPKIFLIVLALEFEFEFMKKVPQYQEPASLISRQGFSVRQNILHKSGILRAETFASLLKVYKNKNIFTSFQIRCLKQIG
ncbi:hypothetical protein AA313_de0207236 [Arthrobotrys entomopaga]|nr:hypothetical protein AA313_de0207236 [Arthrobotrys entomopaga]